jgi:hypothetical protein
VSAPQASRSDRKHCLRHGEVIARLLKKENPGRLAPGVFCVLPSAMLVVRPVTPSDLPLPGHPVDNCGTAGVELPS